MRNFYDYTIWRQGIALALDAYTLTLQLPKEEMYSLSSQMKRSAVSIPANIAEGCGRESDGEFKRFLEISLGSAFELETHLIIAERLGFIKPDDIDKFLMSLRSEQRQINTLISRLKESYKRGRDPVVAICLARRWRIFFVFGTSDTVCTRSKDVLT